MSLYSQPAKGTTRPTPVRTPLTSSGLSEHNLNQNINSLTALAAKLKHRSGTPQSSGRATPEPLSHEEERRLAEEAMRREMEEELREYEREGLLGATGVSMHTILSYWKVCAPYYGPPLYLTLNRRHHTSFHGYSNWP
jgi:hypothetical protein